MPRPDPLLIVFLAGLGCAACSSPPPPAPPAPRPTVSGPATEATAAESPEPEGHSEPAPEAIEPPPFMPFGVTECDKFVEKYVACVDVRVPAEQKEKKMDELHEHRARWRELGKMEQGRIAMSLSCRGVAQRLRSDLIVEYGCEF